jgi:hypothetical protein
MYIIVGILLKVSGQADSEMAAIFLFVSKLITYSKNIRDIIIWTNILLLECMFHNKVSYFQSLRKRPWQEFPWKEEYREICRILEGRKTIKVTYYYGCFSTNICVYLLSKLIIPLTWWFVMSKCIADMEILRVL